LLVLFDLADHAVQVGENLLVHLRDPGLALARGYFHEGERAAALLAELGQELGAGEEDWAGQAPVLVNAGGAERAAAGAGGDLAEFEMAEELGPFLVAGDAVFLGGPQGPAAGQERQVGLDRLVGIDG